jgi:transcriptional regulator with XRE-family HTH domain
MGVSLPPTRRQELAEFLRLLRERTAPEQVGLQANGRRRTPGLRREEVAQLADVGLSWYTWLEQGRDITPSAGVLDALARVFGLGGAERVHLFDLAEVAVPAAADPYPTEAPPELVDWVRAHEPMPAYVLNPRTDILAWNRGAERVIGHPDAAPDGTPNLLWWLFARLRWEGPMIEQTARDTLARFRAAHARRYDDPGFRVLIEALLEHSPTFRELWPRHEVSDSQFGTKVIDRPGLGRLRLLHQQVIPTTHPELRLTQFLPADEATRRALERADMGASRNGRCA